MWSSHDHTLYHVSLPSTVTMLRWDEPPSQAYLEEMAAMLIQAQGDGNSQAGQRLQRLTTELVRICRPVTWAQWSASWLVNPAVQHFLALSGPELDASVGPSPITIDQMLMMLQSQP